MDFCSEKLPLKSADDFGQSDGYSQSTPHVGLMKVWEQRLAEMNI
jgi:hypothetical protein